MSTPPYATQAQFIEKYIDFCASPLRDREMIREDLAQLAVVPMVKLMAFMDENIMPSTLMVGLRPLYITDPETGIRHFIGNFIIYITRYRDYPVWIGNFELNNLNPYVCPDRSLYLHPHMHESEHPIIGRIAHICISRGRYPIFQYIRKGELYHAVELIINLLQSLGPNAPFHHISYWPKARIQS